MPKWIKVSDPHTDKKEENAIKKVLKSHFWASGSGTGNVSKFEKEFLKYINAKKCIAVNSGTGALHLALSLAEIRNKEVILPSHTFASTANAVLYNGGIPIFVDIDPKTLCLDPIKIKKAITKKTRVILPVHFAGMACNLDEITKLCNSTILLIEDAAHAVGTKYKNEKIGTHGSAVCFSFHPAKNLAMPTGGAITLNDNNASKYEKILRSTRWCGITNRKQGEYDIGCLGWNYYMNEFSATIGLEQLKKIDRLNLRRKRIAKIYSKEIEVENKMPYQKDCSFHLYWIQVSNRKKFRKNLKENGIETAIHYNPIHKMSFFQSKLQLPITEKIGREIVSIPMHPNLTNNDLDKIIKLTNKYS